MKQIKEKRCSVSPAPLSEEKFFEDKKVKEPYHLPDGSIIELSYEKHRAPEIRFSPEKMGLEFPGVHELLMKSINSSDLDLRKALCSEIILSGGTTCLQGFPERLLGEIKKLIPKDLKIKIFASPDRQYLTWIGGTILCNLTSFKEMWITRREWEEDGERMLMKKCL